MMDLGILAPVAGAVGLIVALIIYMNVTRQSTGTDKMRSIGEEIHLGAMTFLKAQYSKLFFFVIIVAALLYFSKQHGAGTSIAFIAGALTSALAGFVGMKAATKGNVRTAAAGL